MEQSSEGTSMPNIKKAHGLIKSVEFLLGEYDGVMQDSQKAGLTYKLTRAIELIERPAAPAPQIIARQTDHRVSCGYLIPIQKTCWYWRVEMLFSPKSHLPDMFFLVDPRSVNDDGAQIVGVCKDGFLGKVWVDGKMLLGFAYVNGGLTARREG